MIKKQIQAKMYMIWNWFSFLLMKSWICQGLSLTFAGFTMNYIWPDNFYGIVISRIVKIAVARPVFRVCIEIVVT